MPLGAAYYDGDLMLQPEHYLSTEERLEILNTHPLFTGVCPNYGEAIAAHQEFAGEGMVHYDCEGCGWMDDSVV